MNSGLPVIPALLNRAIGSFCPIFAGTANLESAKARRYGKACGGHRAHHGRGRNGKAAFIVCSIGGYIVFEFLRRYRARVSALALCDTRPQPDTTEARANRLKNADLMLEQGTEQFLADA